MHVHRAGHTQRFRLLTPDTRELWPEQGAGPGPGVGAAKDFPESVWELPLPIRNVRDSPRVFVDFQKWFYSAHSSPPP